MRTSRNAFRKSPLDVLELREPVLDFEPSLVDRIAEELGVGHC
jgi:hypothetical protein